MSRVARIRNNSNNNNSYKNILRLEIVFTRAAPAFDNLFMGCLFNINTVHKTVEKLTFEVFY